MMQVIADCLDDAEISANTDHKLSQNPDKDDMEQEKSVTQELSELADVVNRDTSGSSVADSGANN